MKRLRVFSCFLILFLFVGTSSAQFYRHYASYQHLTENETTRFDEIIWFWGVDVLEGDVHSNDFIGMKGVNGQPTFLGRVSTSQSHFGYASGADPYFAYPPVFNAPEIFLPTHLDTLRLVALEQGNYFPSNSEDPQQGRLTGVDVGWVLEEWPVGVPYDSATVTVHDTIGYMETEWLFVFCNYDLEIRSNHAQGKNLVGSAGTMRIIDNVFVEGATIENGGTVEEDNGNLIFLTSEQSILVGDTYENGQGNGGGSGAGHDHAHCIITAAMMSLGESFAIEHQNDIDDSYFWCDPQGEHPGQMDERGDLIVNGSIIQRRRGYVHRSCCGGTGVQQGIPL